MSREGCEQKEGVSLHVAAQSMKKEAQDMKGDIPEVAGWWNYVDPVFRRQRI